MVNASELGSCTNNISNKRGIKKLLKEVSDIVDDLDDVYTKSETYSKTEVNTLLGDKANSADVYSKSDTYTKTEVTNLLSAKVNIASALPTGKVATDTVTFQDLIDLGIIVIPPEPEPETEN